MLETNRGKFGLVLCLRRWSVGFAFGPEVYELYLGPFTFWFDPEGLNEPNCPWFIVIGGNTEDRILEQRIEDRRVVGLD